MTSKLGDAPRKSAAAYLLFYRRRSDKPLGPQYLQDLVTEFRNPPEQANSNSADESYGSDSGEGRLGDPSSILRGSSSNSVGAGVEATTGLQHQARTTLPDDGNGSAGQQAGQNLKPRALGMSDDEGIDMAEDGPAGNNRQYGNVGPPSWDFEALNSKLADSSNAEMRPLDKVDGDADSTAAEHDTEREDSWNDLEQGFQLGGDPTTDDEYQDNHALYSGSRESGALHLEDTTMMSDDAPAIDINLPDANAKTD
jgi:ubiquitin carboxyl-terminal hydrolase 4/11/15